MDESGAVQVTGTVLRTEEAVKKFASLGRREIVQD